MLVLLSPAKTMKPVDGSNYKLKAPYFPEETQILMEHLKSYEAAELEKIMKVNPAIAKQNYDRYQYFLYDTNGSPALITYTGLQYKNVKADTFSVEDFEFANSCVRILSGLYGVLHPYSSIYPYRLDFEMKLNVPGYENLYAFWDRKIFNALKAESDLFVNLTSKEYAKTILPFVENESMVVTCSFYVEKNGKRKMESTAAKMARGLMTGYIVKNRICKPELLKAFQENDFKFQEELSSKIEYVYIKRV